MNTRSAHKVNTDKHYTRRALTIIELLVVIAVLTLLAGILISVTRSVTSISQRTKSAANLRQIGVQWHLYFAEGDRVFPIWFDPGAPITSRMWAQKVLGPDMDKPKHFVHPGASDWREWSEADNYYRWFAFTGGTHYGMNVRLTGWRMGMIERPAEIVMGGERQSTLDYYIPTARNWFDAYGGANFLFVDGRVEFQPLQLQGNRLVGPINAYGSGHEAMRHWLPNWQP